MPSIRITHSVDVYRLTVAAGKEAYAVTPVYSGVRIGLYPAGTDIIALYPGESSVVLYEGYLSDQYTFKNGDKLKSGTDEWIIKGVPQVISIPQLYQIHLVCEKVV